MDGEIAAAVAVLEAERQRLDALCRADAMPEPALLKARNLIAEAIGSLQGIPRTAAAASTRALADRIVLIEPAGTTEGFRTRVKLKLAEPPSAIALPPAPALIGDDLTRIRGVDAVLAAKLAAMGVASFAAIAGWTHADVRRISDSLGLGRKINRQNWIEQAALLRDSTAPPVQPPAPAPAADLSPAALEAAPSTPQPEPDRLVLIAGIDDDIADALIGSGSRQWADISNWRRADIARVEERLTLATSVSRQGWIEQAAILASGRLTMHARRMLAGDFACLVEMPTPEPLAPPVFTDWQAPQPNDDMASPESLPTQTIAFVPAPVPSAHAVAPAPTYSLAALPEPPVAIAPSAAPAPTGPPAAPEPLPPPAEAAAAEGSLSARVDALEQELVALVANDTAADPVLSPPAVAPPPPAPDAGLHIEDEEFPELDVGEADVVIVPAKSATPAPAADRPAASPGRNLLARLRRASPLDDIDSNSYAAYRDRVEEASVEIITPPAADQEAGQPLASDTPSTARRLGPFTRKS